MSEKPSQKQNMSKNTVFAIYFIFFILAIAEILIYDSMRTNTQNITAENKRLSEQCDMTQKTIEQHEKESVKRFKKLAVIANELWEANTSLKNEVKQLETRVVTSQQGLNRMSYVFLRSLNYSEETAWQMANKIALNPTIDYWDTIVKYIPIDEKAIQRDLDFADLVTRVDELSFDMKDNENQITITEQQINFLVNNQENIINDFIKEHSTWLTHIVIDLDD